MVALDVGANIGEYVLILAARVGRSGRVHAFEPDPRNCEVLARNIRRSGMGARIRVERAALSDYCGKTILHLDRDGARNTIAPGALLPEPRGSISVPCLTIDRFVERQSLQRLDFLKIDAEGAELSILRGGRRALAELRPMVLAEVRQDLGTRFGVRNAEVLEFMRSLGYSPRTARPAGGREPAGNVFFMPDSATSFPTRR
jgi:FkbM family methyltransferase